MDMQTILVCTFIIATIGHNTSAQQIYQNLVQVARKPAQNEYMRLSEIPFENAVRAVATPPRDYVPIHEHQQDIPPPPKPQPVTNQPAYNTYNQPERYTNVVLGYNTHSFPQQVPNSPMSYQYMTTNPKEVYNYLQHSAPGNNEYLQGQNYLQQAYNPNAITRYQAPVTYLPVMHNNFGAVLRQRIKPVPVYNNYQSSNAYSNFRPSIPLPQNSVIDLTNYQNSAPTHRFRTGKRVTPTLPSNNNVQYLRNVQGTNGFVPSTVYVPRSARMTNGGYSQGYSMPNSEYVTGGIQYLNMM